MDINEKIKQAAHALSAALTAGGRDYMVMAHAVDVTTIYSEGKRYAYTVYVKQMTEEEIAP